MLGPCAVGGVTYCAAVALRFLLPVDQRTPEVIGASLWWLSNNPEVANFQSGMHPHTDAMLLHKEWLSQLFSEPD